jgi:hypothetical protein
VIDEVEESRVGPLEILEHEDDGPLFGDALEERPPGGEELVAIAATALVDAQQLQEARLDPAPLALIRDVLIERLGDARPRGRRVVGFDQSGSLAHHLAESPERDPLAVRGRAALVPVDGLADPVDVLVELPGETALADTRLADHGHEPEASLAGGGVEQLLDQPKLRLAAHERGFEDVRATRPADHAHDADRAPGRHR